MTSVICQRENHRQKHQFPCRSKVERIKTALINCFTESYYLILSNKFTQVDEEWRLHTLTHVQSRKRNVFMGCTLRVCISTKLHMQC